MHEGHAYYGTEPSLEALAVMHLGHLPEMSQTPGFSEVMGITLVPELVRKGLLCLYHYGDVVLALSRATAYIGRVDVFVVPGTQIEECIKAGKAFLEWAQANSTFVKLESRSPERSAFVVAKRCGWKHEGTRRHCFRKATGEFVDEYEMGFVLGDRSCQQQ